MDDPIPANALQLISAFVPAPTMLVHPRFEQLIEVGGEATPQTHAWASLTG